MKKNVLHDQSRYLIATPRITEPYLIRDGLKPGDGLVSVLLNLTLDYVVRKMQFSELGATLNETAQILGYADDLELVGGHRETVPKNSDILIEAAKNTGLEVSHSKTKYIVIDRLGICARTLMIEIR